MRVLWHVYKLREWGAARIQCHQVEYEFTGYKSTMQHSLYMVCGLKMKNKVIKKSLHNCWDLPKFFPLPPPMNLQFWLLSRCWKLLPICSLHVKYNSTWNIIQPPTFRTIWHGCDEEKEVLRKGETRIADHFQAINASIDSSSRKELNNGI